MTFVFGDYLVPSLVAMGGKSWICIIRPDPEKIAASWMRLADCEFCWEDLRSKKSSPLQLHTVDGRNPAPHEMYKAL